MPGTEKQTFHERPHLAGHRSEVDGRAQDHGIYLFYHLQNGCQIVFYRAPTIALSTFDFAGKAAYAALEVEIVEVDHFCLRPL